MTDYPGAERRTRYLLDENIARSVTFFLTERGYEAIESREVVGPQAADRVLQWLASREKLILVTHDRDFKSMLHEATRKQRASIRSQALILWLNVREPGAVQRLRECIDLIEHHVQHAERSGLRIEMIHVQSEVVIVRYRIASGS